MMTPLRASTEIKIERAGLVIARVIVGLVMFAFGVVFDFLEYHPPPAHTVHIAIFTAIALLGLLVAAGRFLFPVIQNVVVIAGQTNLPFVGGRRSTDDKPSPPSGP
jgi:hypothetical protein